MLVLQHPVKTPPPHPTFRHHSKSRSVVSVLRPHTLDSWDRLDTPFPLPKRSSCLREPPSSRNSTGRSRTEILANQTTDWPALLSVTVAPLFKPKVHVVILKVSWNSWFPSQYIGYKPSSPATVHFLAGSSDKTLFVGDTLLLQVRTLIMTFQRQSTSLGSSTLPNLISTWLHVHSLSDLITRILWRFLCVFWSSLLMAPMEH